MNTLLIIAACLLSIPLNLLLFKLCSLAWRGFVARGVVPALRLFGWELANLPVVVITGTFFSLVGFFILTVSARFLGL